MRDQDEADTSGSTAEFRAFAERDPGTDVSQKAQRNQVAKLAAIAVGVAVLLAIVAFLIIH
jgi:hypothetical protein